MIKIKDIIQKVSNDQFIINEILKESKPFAITESTPEENSYKYLCIDFGGKVNRYVALDNLLLVLKEIYGKDYLINALNEFKSYDDIKDKVVSKKL